MICPQNGRFCDDKFCLGNQSCEREKCERLDLPAPPKPTMAEIERLVDAYAEKATFTPYAHPHDYKNAKADEAAARASLLTAIRAYGEG